MVVQGSVNCSDRNSESISNIEECRGCFQMQSPPDDSFAAKALKGANRTEIIRF
jgi:hypothetical protein